MNRVEENKQKFLQLLDGITRQGLKKLVDYLENNTDFFTAPASTMFHGNCEGGLCEHSLNVYKLFSKKNIDYNLGLEEDSVKIMALFHDICKVNCYKQSTRNRKIDGKWVALPWYDFEDTLPYGHGEKSVWMLEKFIRLKTNEAMAVRWHMGLSMEQEPRTISKAFDTYAEAVCLHTADLEASKLLERTIDYEEEYKLKLGIQSKMNI